MTIDELISALIEIKRDGAPADKQVFMEIDSTFQRSVGAVEIESNAVVLKRALRPSRDVGQ